jgi:hypothetical protein
MQTLSYMRAEEEPETGAAHPAGGIIIPESLLGVWVNTNSATRGIAKVVLAARENQVVLRVFGKYDPELYDWGEVNAGIFASDINSTEAMAWSAFYEFEFMDIHLQAHIRQGVLIIAKFDRFKDDSGRSNYFSKEFFYRLDT